MELLGECTLIDRSCPLILVEVLSLDCNYPQTVDFTFDLSPNAQSHLYIFLLENILLRLKSNLLNPSKPHTDIESEGRMRCGITHTILVLHIVRSIPTERRQQSSRYRYRWPPALHLSNPLTFHFPCYCGPRVGGFLSGLRHSAIFTQGGRFLGMRRVPVSRSHSQL